MYTYDEVMNATLKYFHGNQMLTNIWLSKYCLKKLDGSGYLELTPDERFRAIAKESARIERKFVSEFEADNYYEKIYELIKDFHCFIPGGSIIYGTGNSENLSSLGNCFVIGNNTDSYGSICLIDQEQIQLMKRRGGVGHDLSHLRPKHSIVNGCAATSTGAFSFAPRYSNSTREVAQEGRRGALMLSAHINHPDIEDFITLKDDRVSCTGANISVRVDDEFMKAVVENKEHKFRFPIESDNVTGTKNAQEIFAKIVHQAWKNGEPGLLFWDTITRESPADCYKDLGFKTISTNPCGEIPLSPYDSCRLGHCNLYAYIENPYTDKARFNEKKFMSDARLMQRFMDNIIELEIEKIDAIINNIESSYEDISVKNIELNLWRKVRKVALDGRRTGLGILGEADAVAALGYRYSSKEANDFLIYVHRLFACNSYIESINLAKQRGSFKVFDYNKEKENPFVLRILNEIKENQELYNVNYEELFNSYIKYGRRNISNLTLAPTGTVSQFGMRSGVTSGMEPVFETFYYRRRKINTNDTNAKVDYIDEVGDKFEMYRVIHPGFVRWAEVQGYKDIDKMSDEEFDGLVKKSPYYKATANDVDVISKIHLQGAIQKWVDHSISVTHNLPNSTTEDDIYKFYIEAWKSGCKGTTVYRDGSRSGVLVHKPTEDKDNFKYKDAVKRPKSLDCDIHKLQALKETWMILIGLFDERPYEVFALKYDKIPSDIKTALKNIDGDLKGKIIKRNKKVYDLTIISNDKQYILKDIASYMESDDDRFDTRHFSLDLRHGIDPRWIIELFDKQDKSITSFERAISRVLKKYIVDGEKSGLVCPNCGSTNVIYSSGCPLCKDCGYSKCG